MVPVIPGMAPTITPHVMPPKMAKTLYTEAKRANPATMFSIILCFSPSHRLVKKTERHGNIGDFNEEVVESDGQQDGHGDQNFPSTLTVYQRKTQ